MNIWKLQKAPNKNLFDSNEYMEFSERALKDIQKLEKALHDFVSLGLSKKYKQVLDWAMNYFNDAKHFYENKDYFTAFGAANYAYGMIDAILIAEGKKEDK